MRNKVLILQFVLYSVMAVFAAAEQTTSFEVFTDGQGAFVYQWAGERVAFSLDARHSGRPEIVSFLWGDHVIRFAADVNGDEKPEMMAVFAADGTAVWYEMPHVPPWFPLMDASSPDYAKAKELLSASIVRRVSVDDGTLSLAKTNSDAATLPDNGTSGSEVSLTIILFPAYEVSSKITSQDERPMPIRLPPINATAGKTKFFDFTDLLVPKSPFDDALKLKASVRLMIYPYDVQRPFPPPEAPSVVDHRIQVCTHIIVEGERDDRFCMDGPFPENSPLIANAPSTDLTGRTQGSWVIEIHRKGIGK